MEGNHTDVARFHQEPPPRVDRRLPEKPKARERLSITEWMAQTLEEMKRRVGWFKENPEVTQIRRLTGEYPSIQKRVETQLTRVERQADEALREATDELKTVIEGPLTIEMAPQERYVQPVSVDFTHREEWQDFKIQLINEFERAFGKAGQRDGDFEVSLSAPLSGTTLSDLRERGPQAVRVRSESIVGVRMDALMVPPNSSKVSEYRIYGLDGYFRTIPGDQDPVEALIDQARTNQITYQIWVSAEQRSRETQQILMGDRWTSMHSKLYGEAPSLEELVKKHRAKLGTPEEYLQPEKILRVGRAPLQAEPAVGPLTAVTRAEPAVQVEKHRGDWTRTEPGVEPMVDEFADAMRTTYGTEVSARLSEHMFSNQAVFDDYFRAWDSATHNTSLKPEQQELIKKVSDALKTEAKERGLADKGSYIYLIESYKNIENDLPQLKESIDTVKDIMADPQTAPELLPSLQKELNYLNHLRIRIESNPKRTLHQAVEKFLDHYQHLFTLDEIRQIWQADQALDQAEQVDDARKQVAEAMDLPGRIVLDQTLGNFIRDYARFMPSAQTAVYEEKREALKSYPETLNFWDQMAEINDAMNSVKRRAWDRILVESLGRVTQALKKYGNEMNEEAYPIVNKLKADLQEGVGQGELHLNPVQNILKKFEPVQFEEYVTQILWAATGQDMRPAWKKTDEEVQLTSPEVPKSETWVQAPRATPVEVEWEEEPEAGRAGDTIVPKKFALSAEAVETDEEEEYEDVSAEIPGLLQGLRSVRGTSEEARLAVSRAKEILASAGSEEMLEITKSMLDRLDTLKSSGQLEDRIYRRALAVLLSADNFEDREQAVADLRAELPVPLQAQENKTQVSRVRGVGGTRDKNQEVA